MPREKKLYSDAIPGLGLISFPVLATSLPTSVITTGVAVLAAGFRIRFLVRLAARIDP